LRDGKTRKEIWRKILFLIFMAIKKEKQCKTDTVVLSIWLQIVDNLLDHHFFYGNFLSGNYLQVVNT